jgi:hypothetical protein
MKIGSGYKDNLKAGCFGGFLKKSEPFLFFFAIFD